MRNNQDVLIIGGGIIGVCAAYFLTKEGRQVTLLEQAEVSSGCSYGNAGLLVPSHSMPLAAPGALSQGLKWLLDSESPFFVKPRLDAQLLSWLWRFQANCKEGPMRRAIPVLRDLQRASLALYRAVVSQEQLECDFEQKGLLMLYKTKQGYQEGVHEAQLMQEYGLPSEILDAQAVRALEPAVHPDISGGVHFKEDGRIDPAKFTRELARCAQSRGATIQTQTEVLGFETRGRRITAVQTTRGDYRPDQVILAAGAWSPGLGRDLRLKLPIQPAKGYSLTIKRPANCPRLPWLCGEARVAVTPFKAALRFAGTLELAGFDLTINRRRVEAIRRAIGAYLDDLGDIETLEIWRGLRPCTPDGLPFIGRSGAIDNLIVATGHAMLGVSLGPVSGQLVAQIACEQPTLMDLSPLRLERY